MELIYNDMQDADSDQENTHFDTFTTQWNDALVKTYLGEEQLTFQLSNIDFLPNPRKM